MNQNPLNPNALNTEDTSDLCPPFSTLKGMRPKVGRPLSRMACLSERQLEHINAWLDEETSYKKVVELCRTEFQIDIPKTTIQRYYKRSASRTLIADLADSKEAAAEISKYAVTGDPSFSTNTLEILEQQAFDLAVAFNRDAEADDLATLGNVWSLIHKGKNTNIRERHAAVQEQKLELRREEFALKRELALARLNKSRGGTSSTSPTSIPRNAINRTHAAPADSNSTHAEISSALSASQSEIQNQKSEIECAPFERYPGPCPLPLEIVIENRRYAEKLLAGLIDPVTGEELPEPNQNNSDSPSSPFPPVQDSAVASVDAQENGGAL